MKNYPAAHGRALKHPLFSFITFKADPILWHVRPLATSLHPNTGQPVHTLLWAHMQATYKGPAQAPTGVNIKHSSLMTPASAESGQQTQLHALAKAHWKPSTLSTHFKPYFLFAFENWHVNNTVVSAYLNTRIGSGYGQRYCNSIEYESTGWARWARNWLLSVKHWFEETEHVARAEKWRAVPHHEKSYPFPPLFPTRLFLAQYRGSGKAYSLAIHTINH